MERGLPGNASSFTTDDRKACDPAAMNSPAKSRRGKPGSENDDGKSLERTPTEKDNGEGRASDSSAGQGGSDGEKGDAAGVDLASMYAEIDRYLTRTSEDDQIPEAAVEAVAAVVEKQVSKFEVSGEKPVPLTLDKAPPGTGDYSFLDAVERLSRVSTAGDKNQHQQQQEPAVRRAAQALQRVMTFLEDEFRTLLEERGNEDNDNEGSINSSKTSSSTEAKGEGEATASSGSSTKDKDGNAANSPTPILMIYPPEAVERLRRIASAMITAGYETECLQAYSIARREAMKAALDEQGFASRWRGTGAEEVKKMAWEKLEEEIGPWIAAFRKSISVAFPRERCLCDAVFEGQQAVSASLFSNLARGVVIQLLNFAEAVTSSPRSGEKLFKLLDMYETMRDLIPVVDGLFSDDSSLLDDQARGNKPGAGGDHDVVAPPPQPPSLLQSELKSEFSTTKARLGDTVVGIFHDLENSIKNDNGKTPVPGGAIHPLTRYVMNYLKYACEYKTTLEQVFQEEGQQGQEEQPQQQHHHHHHDDDDSSISAFGRQLRKIMELLSENLEAKARLYKDQGLSHIFLMNNGRYIVQKIKCWPEINELLGENWCRRRSAELRQHHKNYQRETWGKVLGTLRVDESAQGKGSSSASKTAIKERFKSFNTMFEEIHKAQSCWVVGDEQLQSELRVSISAVVIPAYRSFLGRYRQHIEGSRHSEKYIKYAPEDLETFIEDLFDGNPASMSRRRS